MFEGIFSQSVTIVDENGDTTVGKSVAKNKEHYDQGDDMWLHLTEVTYEVTETESDVFSVGDEIVLAKSKTSDHSKNVYIIVEGENKVEDGAGTYISVNEVS